MPGIGSREGLLSKEGTLEYAFIYGDSMSFDRSESLPRAKQEEKPSLIMRVKDVVMSGVKKVFRR